MKLPGRASFTLKDDTVIKCAVIGYVAISWSWLFTSSVSELAESAIVGYSLAVFSFLVSVSLSSYIYIKFIFYFRQRWLQKDNVSYKVLPLFFVLWAATEYFVSLLTTLIWFGQDGSLDSVSPFGSFTPIVSHTPMGFLARFVGFHGLSAAVMVIILVLSVQKLRHYAVKVSLIVLIATFAAWGFYKTPTGEPFNALIVSESLGQNASKVSDNYELVVFPEYGIDKGDKSLERFVVDTDDEVHFVGSKQASTDKGHANVLVFGSSTKGVTEERAKSRLIPGGEYLPYFAHLMLAISRAENTIEYFQGIKAIQKGPPNYSPLAVSEAVRLGSAVCASIISPEDYRRFTNNGATVLTNSASLGIFKSRLFNFQHQGFAKFMATANARPFLQSSNDAEAFAIDQNGKMTDKIAPIGTKEVKVTNNTAITPYTLVGEWPVYCGFITIMALVFRRFRR